MGIRTPRTPVGLAARIPAVVLRRVESRTGLPAGRLDAATLDWFLPAGWVNLHGSRYCPACLAESDGRWARSWRLTWTFACTTHRFLLPVTCPACRCPPRNGLAATRRVLPAGTCPNRRGAARFCGVDLRTTSTVLLVGDDPLLGGQRRIDSLLAAADPGSKDLPATFTDLHILAGWLLHHATEDDVADFGPHARHAWQTRHQHGDDEHGGIPAFAGTALIGTSATLALVLLSDEDSGTVSGLRPLLTRAGSRRTRPNGMSQPQWRRMSPPVHARFLHAADPELGNTDRIRYRSCLPTARPPDLDPDMLDRRTRGIPQLLWPEWTVRLLPTDGFTSHAFRAVIAACLLLPGNPAHPLHQVTDRLHPYLTGQRITLTLRELATRGHQPVFTAICLLADHLDHHGSPIDYQRRRTVIPPIPIDEEQWRQLCFRAGAHPGEDRRLLDAQRYLYQTLTGADLDNSTHPLAFRSSADRSAYLAFTTSLTTDVPATRRHQPPGTATHRWSRDSRRRRPCRRRRSRRLAPATPLPNGDGLSHDQCRRRPLGAHQAALVRQLQRLERDIGAPLSTAPPPPMQPTPRGQVLLRALIRPDIRARIENAKKK